MYYLQVLTGLRVLHDAGIAHRDIKADNLLLADDGTVKLADFGSAKRISMSTVMMQTNAQQIRGSPLWMAPAMKIKSKNDEIKDIWIHTLGKTFDLSDDDGNGTIDADELVPLLRIIRGKNADAGINIKN